MRRKPSLSRLPSRKRTTPRTGSRVVLTVAHLDHQPENCEPETFDAGVSDATSPTMPNTMSKPENEELALSATTANRRFDWQE